MPNFSVVTLKARRQTGIFRLLQAVLYWWSWVPESERWAEFWSVAGRTLPKWMPDYQPHGRVGVARACPHCLFIIHLWGSMTSTYGGRNWRIDAHIRLLTRENPHLMVRCNHPVGRRWAWLCTNLQPSHGTCSHGQSVPVESMEALAPHTSSCGERALLPQGGWQKSLWHTQCLSSLGRVEVEL